MNTHNLSRRFKACYYLSAINFLGMALPTLQAPNHLVLSIAVVIMNVAACWWILHGVEPSRDPDTHEGLAAFGKRGMIYVGILGAALMVSLGFTERLGRQAIPFMLFGFAYFSVALRVLHISTQKRMDELRVKT